MGLASGGSCRRARGLAAEVAGVPLGAVARLIPDGKFSDSVGAQRTVSTTNGDLFVGFDDTALHAANKHQPVDLRQLHPPCPSAD